MRRKTVCAILVCVGALLTGCATQPTQEQTGMVVGGVVGGVLGSQIGRGHGSTAGTILGSIAGAAIGGALGRSMDDTDRMKTGLALENVRTGVPSTWRNPDTGNAYTVVPTRTYETAQGPCREYTVDAVVAGKKDRVYGTACRQADGSWRTTG